MDHSMEFRSTMRMLFHKKADHLVGTERERRHWLRKTVRKLLRDVDQLDTTLEHKKLLASQILAVSDELSNARDVSWILVYRLLRLCMGLFGYVSYGARCFTPIFCRRPNQYYTAVILNGGDTMQDYYDRKNLIAIRQKVVKDLSREGLDTFMISLVLNTSEYQVKKLRGVKSGKHKD